MPANHPEDLLQRLRKARSKHGFRAETLVPDLAFIGLVDDCIDAAEEGLALVTGKRPHRGYAMARAAFEAAQRLLILATSDDYVALGTRAWLYYVGKDERLSTGPSDNFVADYRDQIIETWTLRFPGAPTIIEKERAELKHMKGPDNFFGGNLAVAVGNAYAVIGEELANDVPSDVVEVTRDAYRALCRDTHACLRLEPIGIKIDSDGFVEVVERQRKRSVIEEAVRTSIKSSLSEAISSVVFRLKRRQSEKVQAIGDKAATNVTVIRPDFRRDFGLYLVETGLANAMQVLTGVLVRNVAALPDGTLTCSTTITVGDEVLMATFDFKGETRSALIAEIRRHLPGFTPPIKAEQPQIVHLNSVIEIGLAASVETFHRTAEEQFAPLIVEKVF
jgi:hypothetical protein